MKMKYKGIIKLPFLTIGKISSINYYKFKGVNNVFNYVILYV